MATEGALGRSLGPPEARHHCWGHTKEGQDHHRAPFLAHILSGNRTHLHELQRHTWASQQLRHPRAGPKRCPHHMIHEQAPSAAPAT